MKLLLISILRPGDFVMHLSLIRGAKEKYPHAELHLLVQDICLPFVNLLDDSVVLHVFRRSEIINFSRDSSFPLTTPIHILSDLIAKLKDENFDVVINLTHNRISGLIAGELKCEVSFGLSLSAGKVFGLETAFAKDFNNKFANSNSFSVHYVESLARICQLPVVPRKNQTSPRQLRTVKKVSFQFLSSDTKKDFPLNLARKLVDRIKAQHIDVEVLAAPFEKDELLNLFSEREVKVVGLSDLRSAILNTDILISVDTLQLHLADELSVPTLGLHLGPSNVNKTGAFLGLQEAVLGKASCYPCQHSSMCPHSSRICADVDLDKVLNRFEALKNKVESEVNASPTFQISRLSESRVSAGFKNGFNNEMENI